MSSNERVTHVDIPPERTKYCDRAEKSICSSRGLGTIYYSLMPGNHQIEHVLDRYENERYSWTNTITTWRLLNVNKDNEKVGVFELFRHLQQQISPTTIYDYQGITKHDQLRRILNKKQDVHFTPSRNAEQIQHRSQMSAIIGFKLASMADQFFGIIKNYEAAGARDNRNTAVVRKNQKSKCILL